MLQLSSPLSLFLKQLTHRHYYDRNRRSKFLSVSKYLFWFPLALTCPGPSLIAD